MKYKEHSETWRRNGLADLKYKVLDRVPLAKGTEKVRYSKQTTVACCVEHFMLLYCTLFCVALLSFLLVGALFHSG